MQRRYPSLIRSKMILSFFNISIAATKGTFNVTKQNGFWIDANSTIIIQYNRHIWLAFCGSMEVSIYALIRYLHFIGPFLCTHTDTYHRFEVLRRKYCAWQAELLHSYWHTAWNIVVYFCNSGKIWLRLIEIRISSIGRENRLLPKYRLWTLIKIIICIAFYDIFAN